MNRSSILSRWKRPRACYLLPETSFEDWCRRHAGSACHLIISGRLMHEMTFEDGLPLRDDSDRRAYARQLFTHYFGSAAQHWPLAVRDGGASAFQGMDWEGLQSTAKAHGVALRGAEPFWAPLLRRLRQTESELMQYPRAALAWVDGLHCSWIVLEQGHLQSIRQLRLRDASPSALDEALPAFNGLIRVMQADPQMLAGPGKEAVRASFLPLRRRASAIAWGLLATSLAALTTAAFEVRASYQAFATAQSREASLQSRFPAPSSKPTLIAASSKADVEAERRAAEVQALLQLPWEHLLSNVEQIGAKGQVNWLGIDVNAARGDLRLDGLAPDKVLALQLVDHMSDQAGWQQVMLGRLQQADAGLPGQRFDISARFKPAAAVKEGS